MKQLLRNLFDGAPVASRLAIVVSACATSACSVDLPLGDLSTSGGALVQDDAVGAAPSRAVDDALVPLRFDAPALTIDFGEADADIDSTANVGDLDADGFDDMAQLSEDPATGVQYLHIRYGGPRAAEPNQALAFDEGGARLILSNGYGDFIGTSGVTRAGDVDHDGYGDLFLATSICRGARAHEGGYLLYGGPERLQGLLPLDGNAAHLVPPEVPGGGGCTGYRFAAPGDLDGDGFDDLALVNTDPAIPAAGELLPLLYLLYGRAERFPMEGSWSSADVKLGVPADLDRTWINVQAAGDLDGDGRRELIVENQTDADRLFILPGRAARPAGIGLLVDIPVQVPGAFNGIRSRRELGDLDGDGFSDFVLWTDAGGFLFYGGADVFSGELSPSRASAQFDAETGMLIALGDRDGDGDDELASYRYVADDTQLVGGGSVATLSGTRTRLSGVISIAPAPSLSESRIYPDSPDRYLQDVYPAGDLDGDGAQDVFTRSLILYEQLAGVSWDSYPELHVHYGTPAAPRRLAEPR